MSGYSVSASAQANGKILVRFKGPDGFSFAFEMRPAEALGLADDLTRVAEADMGSPDRRVTG